jgi:hypothetical protein
MTEFSAAAELPDAGRTQRFGVFFVACFHSMSFHVEHSYGEFEDVPRGTVERQTEKTPRQP